ncbi:UNKNOWN [Stylonychia lemnae]|uniref:Methyltransferase domain-containing protein n=1 Tax=Stylonychia lemnae TaxID=5949 RepID=A0A078ARE5_STYLE|nr:UNKNOWN [Stylonychia lemnae]|eukprot:CDW83792.1 UNKNOWN [Stylonychia lemnae]
MDSCLSDTVPYAYNSTLNLPKNKNFIYKRTLKALFYIISYYAPDRDLGLMNPGYADLKSENGIFIEKLRNMLDVRRIQLYHHIVITFAEIYTMRGQNILEIGSGRGGGLYYLTKQLTPKSAQGVDFSQAQLPLIVKAGSQDYIIDINASTFSKNKQALIHGVHYSLAEGGHFIQGTIVKTSELIQYERLLKKHFRVEKTLDITEGVLRSIELSSDQTSDFVDSHFPLNNTLSRRGFDIAKKTIMKNQNTIKAALPYVIGLIALAMSPIWVTMLILTSPLIIAGVLLFMYTNVFNPFIKMWFKFMFSSLTNHYQKNDLVILNVGFADLESEDGLYIKTMKDKFDAFRFQLYHYIVMRFGGVNSMNGLSLLETGCGRGGGLHYLSKELNPQSALGIDFCQAQIDYCKQHWLGDKLNINFIKHDVEKLDALVSRNSIDYVVDIESSVFYPDKNAFYRQVSQVLRRDGVFLYGVMMFSFQVNNFEKNLEKYFDIEKREEISKEVQKSLRIDTPNVSDLIENNFPVYTHWILKQSFGIEGTYFFRMMENKLVVYKVYLCRRKKAN